MSRPRVLEDLDQLKSQTVIHTQNISSLQEQMSAAVTQGSASSLYIGQEIYLYEGDVLTPFIVVEKDYVNSGNVILMRKYPLPPDSLGSALSGYLGSSLDTYLEDNYSETIAVSYSRLTLPASNINGTSTSGSRSIFLPSYAELTGNSVTVAGRDVKEGTQFSYFAEGNTVVCTHNDVGINYFLRTPYDISSFHIVTPAGRYSFSSSLDEQYIRPCISISNTSNVYLKIFNDLSNTLATAVVTA